MDGQRGFKEWQDCFWVKLNHHQTLFKYPHVAFSLSLDLFRGQIYEVLTHSENKQRAVIVNVV